MKDATACGKSPDSAELIGLNTYPVKNVLPELILNGNTGKNIIFAVGGDECDGTDRITRTMLGVLKVTQDLTTPKWRYVPIRDFSLSSDIGWSKPVSDIARQLYRKYGLTQDEIGFIETHVKEMK